MSEYQTDQVAFRAGSFGDSYIERNAGESLVASNTSLFAEIFSSVEKIGSVIEFGANIGLNLRAIKTLLPGASLSAVEINAKAAAELKKLEGVELIEGSALDYRSDRQFDLALVKTFLIHINPDFLPQVYQTLYRTTRRYLSLAGYYNRTPTRITYRGHESKLFKRGFAGELLDMFDDLKLVSYGFRYHRDDNFTQDDINWFLLEKVPAPNSDS